MDQNNQNSTDTARNIAPQDITRSTQPEEKAKTSSKKKIALIIIFTILILAIISLTAWIIILKNSQTTKDPQPTNDNQAIATPAKNTENEEVEITDTSILNDLNTKLHYLNWSYTPGQAIHLEDPIVGNVVVNQGYKLYESNGTYPNDDKLTPVFGPIYLYEGRFTDYDGTVANTNYMESLFSSALGEKSKYYTNHWDEVKYIDASIIRDRYKDLYGEEYANTSSNLIDAGCITYIYDSTKDLYFTAGGGCGGVRPYSYELYKEKFTQKDDKAYIYVAFGWKYNSNDDAYGQGQPCAMYKSLVSTGDSSWPKSNLSNSQKGELVLETACTVDFYNNVQVNANNYRDFAQYRYVFEKNPNSSTYHFVKVEKLNP